MRLHLVQTSPFPALAVFSRRVVISLRAVEIKHSRGVDQFFSGSSLPGDEISVYDIEFPGDASSAGDF